MAVQDRIDAEMKVPLDDLLRIFPGGINRIPDLAQRRKAVEQILAARTASVPTNPQIVSEDRFIPGLQGDPDVMVRIYRSINASSSVPGLLLIHGGGMVLGDIAMEEANAHMFTETLGCVTVSVNYRLAPEHPFPAAPHDCYAALVWISDHAAELGIDPLRIALYGASAGGGLVLAVSLMARDMGTPAIAMQMPIYPMIDDQNVTASSHEILDIGIWDRDGNLEAWEMYLGEASGSAEISPYAAPARAADLRGLPPTFIDVGELDLFRDEDIDFAARLLRAGVPTELHVYPGAYHGSETFAPAAALSQRIWERRLEALQRALN